jgi:hypothetical protein
LKILKRRSRGCKQTVLCQQQLRAFSTIAAAPAAATCYDNPYSKVKCDSKQQQQQQQQLLKILNRQRYGQSI